MVFIEFPHQREPVSQSRANEVRHPWPGGARQNVLAVIVMRDCAGQRISSGVHNCPRDWTCVSASGKLLFQPAR